LFGYLFMLALVIFEIGLLFVLPIVAGTSDICHHIHWLRWGLTSCLC
jgi:hypothetical protein